MTPVGTNLGTYTVSGASNVDWEDIAVGPGPVAGTQYLFIGDIGDNGASRANIAVYRVPEPLVRDTQSPSSTTVSGAVKFTFAYPDGPRDAESLFVDPLSKDIYIISKRESPKHLYRAAYPQSSSGTTTLELMTTFHTDSTWLTAADISPDGNEIIVRSTGTTSGRIYLRPPAGSITNAFNSIPTTIPLYSEPQGEAIGFDPNGWGYYTISEGGNQPIYYFNRQPPPAGNMYWDNDGVPAGSHITTGAGLGGSGTWNTSGLKWYNGSAEVPWVNSNNAVFWGTEGTVMLAAGQTVNSLKFKSSGYVVMASTLTLAGSSVVVDSGVTATISSTVAGFAGLAKTGGGQLNLAHSNAYIGGTTVADGALFVTNNTGSGTGAGPVSVNAGATLGGNGIIIGDVTSSGTLAPGDTVGTLHVDGSYSQVTGGRLEIGINSTTNHDQLAVSGATLLAGELAVSMIGGFMPTAGNVFEIITASGFSNSTFTSLNLPTLADSLVWKVNYGESSVTLSVALPGDFNHDGTVDAADYVVWRKNPGDIYTPDDFNVWRANLGQTSGSGSLADDAVPEPTAAAMLIAGILSMFSRRRTVVS
ncbi:MAG: hypothetical protein WD229_09755 [Pirellulales bacterium]